MTPNEQIIFTAFTQSLSRFPDQKLPDDLQGKLNNLPNVRENALELEKLIKTNAVLASLYQEECDRLMAEASDRQKGFLPKHDPDPSNKELGNLVEQICHAPDSAEKAREMLKSEATGGVIGWMKQLFTR
jgi:hypothetical protein